MFVSRADNYFLVGNGIHLGQQPTKIKYAIILFYVEIVGTIVSVRISHVGNAIIQFVVFPPVELMMPDSVLSPPQKNKKTERLF